MVPGSLIALLLLMSVASPITAQGAASASAPIVVLGASYAGGWNLQVPGIPVVNKGVTGQQSFELLARFDADVASAKPRAVIVWGYINDVFRAPEGQMDQSLARARESIQAIVAKARAAEIEPVLATEVTVRERPTTWSGLAASWVGWAMGKVSYQQTINSRVLELNAWLRDYAGREGLLLLDLQPVVSEPSGGRLPAFATADGSHISEAGYQRLSEHVVPILRARFAR